VNPTHVLESLGPAVSLSILPALPAPPAMALCLFAVGEQSWAGPAACAAFVATWLFGVTVVVRMLRKRWTGSHRYTTPSFFLAALAGLTAGFAALTLTAPWQDLMSQPHPTFTMVALDLIANLSPFTAGILAAWTVLGFTEKDVPVQSSHV